MANFKFICCRWIKKMTFRIPVECSKALCVPKKSPRAKPSKLGIQRKQYVGEAGLM